MFVNNAIQTFDKSQQNHGFNIQALFLAIEKFIRIITSVIDIELDVYERKKIKGYPRQTVC